MLVPNSDIYCNCALLYLFDTVLSRIFRLKVEEVTEGWRILYIEDLHPNRISVNKVIGTCSTHGDHLVENLKARGHMGEGSRRRWWDSNNRVNLKVWCGV